MLACNSRMRYDAPHMLGNERQTNIIIEANCVCSLCVEIPMKKGQLELDDPIPTSRRRNGLFLFNRSIPGSCTLCRPKYIEA